MKDNLKEDAHFMARAISLAQKGEGVTSPNPMVGAVIVKDGKIIGESFHKKAGTPHAEVLALKKAGIAARNATMYVNLEPCNHYGRTPPCTDAIIAAGLKRVVTSILDPNPNVKGGGIEKLREAGIEINIGMLDERAKILNEKYLSFIISGKPFVIIKIASTLDGKLATKTGDSQWITSEKARKYAHLLRKSVDAVAVGSGTITKDDPLLTVRLSSKKFYSHRVIFDTNLKISLNAKALSVGYDGTTYIITAEESEMEKAIELKKRGVELIRVGYDNEGLLDLSNSLNELAKRNITSILIEGGARLIASFIKHSLANKIIIVYAPIIIGGQEAIPIAAEMGINKLTDSIKLINPIWRKFGKEMIFTGYFK